MYLIKTSLQKMQPMKKERFWAKSATENAFLQCPREKKSQASARCNTCIYHNTDNGDMFPNNVSKNLNCRH